MLLVGSLLTVTAYTAESWKHASALVSDEDFDASKCVGLSGTEKDTAWCVASCGAAVKPDCPSSFCACEGKVPNDSSLTDAATARDAEIAKRDGDIAGRSSGGADAGAAGEVDAPSDAVTGFDASSCVGLSGTEKDTAWCVASCGAPNKPDCPSNFCKCDGEVGHDSSITDAASATADSIAKRDADVASRGAGAAEAADAASDAFDASTCKGISGTEKDTAWCVASCGAPIKPDCPSTVCACEGDVPFDSSLTGTGSADRDAEVAKRDAEIAKRGAGGSAANDADDAAEANAASDAGTGFDASTCVGVSGTEKDAAWCVASCGAPIKPDCPSTFCICEGDVGHDSSVRDGKADGELSDAAAATADAIAQRDAGIASRGAADSKDSAAGESAALSDPTFDGSSCHRVQEHRADQPGNNEDDDKWCRDHCGLVPPECPALFCKCDPPTYDLPPNMQDTQGEGAHVKGGMIPS